jgi:hypothetical protein
MAWQDQQQAYGHNPGHGNVMFKCGEVVPRNGPDLPEAVLCEAGGTSTSHKGLSIDTALFPFLHPGGKGGFRRGDCLAAMLKQRMQQLMSPFCLMKEYVLVMHQVRSARHIASGVPVQSVHTVFQPSTRSALQVNVVSKLVNGVGESVLHDCIERQKQRNPNDSLSDVMQKVVKRIVPADVPGSPAYHKEGLDNLLAIVHKHGMPTFFLTLTADEVSELRWPEVGDCEGLFQKYHPDCSWRDLPCMMASLFYERVQNFMRDHILRAEDPILGRVLHHTMRYESQVGCHRGGCRPRRRRRSACKPLTKILARMHCSTAAPCTPTSCCGCTPTTWNGSAKRSPPRAASTPPKTTPQTPPARSRRTLR